MKQHSDLISRKNFLMTVLGYPHTHFDKTLPKAIAARKLLRKTQVRRHAVRLHTANRGQPATAAAWPRRPVTSL